MPAASHVKNWLKKHPKISRTARRLMARIPPSIRLGEQFWFWYAFFEESEQWSVDRMMDYQFDRLRDVLAELSRVSSFYRERLNGIDPKELDSIQRFKEVVPTLCREEFADNFNLILSREWKKQRLSESGTSGTTGMALQFYHTLEDDMREWAAICHQWGRIGYIPAESRRAEFRGLVEQGGIIDVYPEQNMIRCSILNLGREHIIRYAEAIKQYNIDYFHGYSSALFLLASQILDNGIPFPEPRGILLASEPVYDWQLAVIEHAFPNAKLFAHYGCAERTILSGWCESRRTYHVLPQYSLVEIDNRSSEIIGTNLFNSINGFVRYRMTDTVLKTNAEPCPDCGRPYIPQLIDLGGRSEDYLFSIEKGWIPPPIITYPLKGIKKLREIQFLQNEPGRIIMRYSTRPKVDDNALYSELNSIETGLRDLFGNSTVFQFKPVDDFPRSKSGKFKWIINNLDEARSLSKHNVHSKKLSVKV